MQYRIDPISDRPAPLPAGDDGLTSLPLSSGQAVTPIPAEHLRLIVDNKPDLYEQILERQREFAPIEPPSISLVMIANALLASALVYALLVAAMALLK